MVNESDYDWLRDHYPALVLQGGGIAGEIRFRASYNAGTNIFRILNDAVPDESDGITLSGAFQIRLEKRPVGSVSRLPALYVEGIEPILDRHFNGGDKSACLCSPFEEHEFVNPDLQFRRFLEQLVIPFLYGQVFYSTEKRWPWTEYAHGGTGLLEAYSLIQDETRAEECLRQLSKDLYWPRIQTALLQESDAMRYGHCFCGAGADAIKCHPRALAGALLLQQDLRKRNIPIS
jgi:hypothetical protein